MLIQYFRKGGKKKMRTKFHGEQVVKERGLGGGIKKGLFIAIWKGEPEDGYIRFGWSLCNTKAGDVFDEDMAKSIAIGRAEKGYSIEDFPPSMQKRAERFRARANAYFKVNNR